MDNFELAKTLFFQGLDFLETGRYPEAEDRFRRSLEQVPGRRSTLTNLSAALIRQRKFAEARALLDEILADDRNDAEAWQNLGILHAEEARHEQALACFEQVLRIDPDDSRAYNHRGNVFLELRQTEVALDCYRRSIALHQANPEAWMNCGNAYHLQKEHQRALDCHARALAIKPDFAAAWMNRGNALLAMGQPREALESYERAVALDPGSAETHLNRGNALREFKQLQAALESYAAALILKPELAKAHMNRANVWDELKAHDKAVEGYARANELKPDLDYLMGALLHTRMKICDWDGYATELPRFEQRIDKGEKASGAFPVLGLVADPALQRKAAEVYAADTFPAQADLGDLPRRSRRDKIRIGYYSADFYNHPVALLMAEVLELHDKSRFELYGFAFGREDHDEVRQRIAAAVDRFIDVRDKSDRQIAELSRAFEIDIAIDLGGFTADSRTGVFALRAAPVQVSYLGYLGTMGAPYIDYLIADRVIIPEASRRHYSEKIVSLPSYQANDSKRQISGRAFTREALGLPANGIVFCCFNNTWKITPPVFDGWMRILKQVEGSVLFLYAENDRAVINLQQEAGVRGIDPARVVFGKRLALPDYLARYRVADLFLDTAPYNAGTTASDALWAGLPVLTCRGETFAGRVAASLLTAIEMPELITATQEDYEALAVTLATDPQRLAQLKEKLARNRLTTPLFDTARFTRHLEAAYTAMFERHLRGLPPENIDAVAP